MTLPQAMVPLSLAQASVTPTGGELLVLLGTLGIFAVALYAGHVVLSRLRWDRPIQFQEEPPPDHWADIIRENFVAAGHLDAQEFDRLIRLTQVFIRDKRFEGGGGFEVTEEVKVTIAAQACYLILRNGLAVYPKTRTIIVYPSTFIPKHLDPYGYVEEGSATLGQAWTMGPVILAWDDTLRGGVHPSDGRNLVFHEFAHQLDMASGETSGTPGGLRTSALAPWARVIGKSHKRLRRDAWAGRDGVLDHYGAENEAEFFAVATEAFFERPSKLKRAFPELYEQLAGFYGEGTQDD